MATRGPLSTGMHGYARVWVLGYEWWVAMPSIQEGDVLKSVRQMLRRPGRPIVVSGPSGVGKDTVLDAMRNGPGCPDRLVFCVTYTSRERRAGEADGIHYHFVTSSDFERRVRSGFFLEWARYDGRFYGTPKDQVRDATESGNDIVLKIDVQGALNVRSALPRALLVFLAPPTLAALESRLRQRRSNDAASLRERLDAARRELLLANEYDYVVTNDEVVLAAARVASVITAERCRVAPRSMPCP